MNLPGRQRFNIVLIGVGLIALIFIFRLFQMQVVDDAYTQQARQISKRTVTVNPSRGQISDRNGKLMVYNDLVYDLMVEIPYQHKNLDTASLIELLNINDSMFIVKMKQAKKNSFQGLGVWQRNLNDTFQARIRENIFKYPGFRLENRYDRNYKTDVAAHVLGFIGEINREELNQTEVYKIGDYIGKKGVEKIYEPYLRGVKGQAFYLVDKLGNRIERFENGAADVQKESGSDLLMSLDADLQAYAEKLFQNKKGSIVAIEPSTGEILTMVTAPNYTPEQFSIQNRQKIYSKLLQDENKPLLNRAVSPSYPPGSIFKTMMALIALEEGIITPHSYYTCHGGFKLGKRMVACHGHNPATSVRYSITVSCNSFYCNVWRDMINNKKYGSREEAYEKWRSYMKDFSVGEITGIDLMSEKKGSLMPASFYNRMYGEGRWNYASNISLSIGQGEIGMTPLQMANAAACIANRGYYITPHLVKKIEGTDLDPAFVEKHETKISKEHYEVVIDGMADVLTKGTGAASNVAVHQICGKTGTAQNPHGKNHSVFIAFAPKDNPKIAVATIVENAGYGSEYAAPITTLVIDHYLSSDSTTALPYWEERILNTNLIQP
jgi:penicillin-binding protein 2